MVEIKAVHLRVSSDRQGKVRLYTASQWYSQAPGLVYLGLNGRAEPGGRRVKPWRGGARMEENGGVA